jgi:hypothetical protein
MKKLKMYLSIALLAVAAGCSTASLLNEKEETAFLSHDIIIGTGGGFSGVYEGYLIDTVGNVQHWEGIAFEHSTKNYIGSLKKNQIEKIKSMIEESGVLKTEYSGKGNITTFITIRGNESAHRISWVGISPDRKVPEIIRAFNSELNEIITLASNY